MNPRLQKAQQQLDCGQINEAEKLCRTSIKLGKDVLPARRLLASCLYNRSVLLLAHPAGHAQAEALLREALSLDARNLNAHNNLGALLLQQRRAHEALPFLTEVVRLDPASRSALANLAMAQEDADLLDAAEASLQRLALLDPANRGAYLLRAALLTAVIPRSDEAIRQDRQRALAQLERLLVDPTLTIADPLCMPATYFRFSYHGECNRQLNRLLAGAYARACPDLLWTAPHVAAWRGPGSRIRIGIASKFLRAHSVGSVAVGFFERLDRTRFELIAIRIGRSSGDALAAEIDRLADRVVELPPGLAPARQAIAALALDVLFWQDIGMEPVSYFLAFARLAPVQLTWFGHPDSSGIDNLDYYVSTPAFESADAQSCYSERLLLLPGANTMSCYRRPALPAELSGRESFGFDDTQHLYCCVQQCYKIQPAMDRLFLGIVERDPAALIVLFAPAEHSWREALLARFASFSPALAARVRFLPQLHYDAYLRFLQLADVVLDTVSFNGFNTTLEAFAMGAPVVSMVGPLQRQRFAYGLYCGAGFPDLVASSEHDYIAIACRLASDRAWREQCCRRIEAGCQRLFDDESFIADFAAAIATVVTTAALNMRGGEAALPG